MARLRSFNTQLLGSHLLVTILTIISMLLLVIFVITFRPDSLVLVQLRDEAEHSVADWQRGASAEVDLRPSQVIQRGLAEALQELCQHWQAAHSIQVDCAIALTGRYLPSGVVDSIYRVAQEDMSNIAKHVGAETVSVSLVEGQHQITLSVTDDGRGFDPAHATSGSHFGLRTMQERAYALGGTLLIERDTHRGTTLRLTVPLVSSQDGLDRR